MRFATIVLIALAFSGSTLATSIEKPDCTNLDPRECVRLSLEWGKRLDQSRTQADDWRVGCTQDRVTREWACFAVKHFGGNKIRIDYKPALGFCYSGVLNNHPGSTAILRIGDFQPISYAESFVCGTTAQTIISQLKTEQRGATRGIRWPSQTIEYEFDPKGFNAAFDALNERIFNPRP